MSQPVALTPATYAVPRHEVHPHDHAVCTYGSESDLHEPLGEFIRDGLQRRELSVFVHSFGTDQEAWDLLERAYPGAAKLRSDQLVVVSLYKDAFEGARGRIDYDHVTGVVGSLLDTATEQGRGGVRIFVDASRTYLSTQRSKEWFDFEAWLGRRLQANVGLVCAYRLADVMQPDIFPQVLSTHAYRFDAKR